MQKVRIKICGLRTEKDINTVNIYRPDYIGFVFADFSKRYINAEQAERLKKALDPGIAAVGGFVNEAEDSVIKLLKDGIIDIAQLHGSEDEEYIRHIKEETGRPVIRAFNMNKIESTDIVMDSPADYVLLDSGTGSGKTFDWTRLKGIRRPYFLAGGLSLDNVEEAVRILQPYAVDVSSGVETNGFKDETLIKEFINKIKI